MTTKHLSGYYPGGYTLSAGYSKLVIDKTADVGGTGVTAPSFATVVNHGTVYGSIQGVSLESGGSLINGSTKNTSASITGAFGVSALGFSTIANFGTIESTVYYASGVILNADGLLTNGSARDTIAVISGFYGVKSEAGATIANFAAILGEGRYGVGVALEEGGTLINGSATDTGAWISGYTGGVSALHGAATIANFGTIRTGGYYGGGGVFLGGGGSLTNGSNRDTIALISGDFGAEAVAVATIANFGTIRARGDFDGEQGAGVYLGAGGSLTNGSTRDTTALIDGYNTGVSSGGAVAIANFGTIEAGRRSGGGINLFGGGSLINGSTHDTTALVYGEYGVEASGAAATVANFGTIRADDLNPAVRLFAGGSLTNGSASDSNALIYGQYGVEASGAAATVANFGTIKGRLGVELNSGGTITNGSAADTRAYICNVYARTAATVANFGTIHADANSRPGVRLLVGGSLTNGSASNSSALIYARYGVEASGGATVVNFGTIEGTIRASVEMYGAGSEVVAEAGSTFIGTVEGGAGRLALAGGGTGTISYLGADGTLTGAVGAYFSGFSSYEIGTGGTWTLAGTNALNAGSVLSDEGTLINSRALTISGTVSIEASAVFRLASGNIAARPSGAASIIDYGLMIESPGTGTTTVGADIYDGGVVEVASGTLDFTSQLSGTGVLKIDAGATLEADGAAASTLTATFTGAAGTLALKTPNAFEATLSGFAAGDIIDLLAIAATGASVNGSDQLVVVDGSKTVATLQLSGDYIGAAFTTGSDGRGGTNVELAPADGVGRASVHGMAAAMASLVAPAGVAAFGRGLSTGLAPMLMNPHVHLQ